MKFDVKKIDMSKIDIKKLPPVIGAALVIIGFVVFWGNVGLIGNFVLLGLVIGIIPYILISYLDYQKVKAVEDQLPVFLLDLAETQKAGMGLPEALKIVSQTDYGRMTPEIKRINDQLSWGIPLQEALERFSRRMRKSTMTTRVIRIIIEAYNSGGDVVRTIESIAEDIVMIKDAEKERNSAMFQHVLVMYAIYFIFIGIVIGLSQTLIPMLEMNVEAAAMGGIMTFQDPCASCIGSANLYCVSCSVYSVVCQMFNLGAGAGCYYNALFILMIVIQGIFSGLVAGQIGENSIVAGFKHSMIMTFSGFGILMILLQIGLI